LRRLRDSSTGSARWLGREVGRRTLRPQSRQSPTRQCVALSGKIPHPRHAPAQPSASPRKLPKQTTVKEPKWRRVILFRAATARLPARAAAQAPMVNGIRTDMVNERLIWGRPRAESR
jgi:hypothetical protein